MDYFELDSIIAEEFWLYTFYRGEKVPLKIKSIEPFFYKILKKKCTLPLNYCFDFNLPYKEVIIDKLNIPYMCNRIDNM